MNPGMNFLDLIQLEHQKWADKNFGDQRNPDRSLMGIMEELGELSHHHLKRRQGIRGTDQEHLDGIRDAVGDLVIYLMDYCTGMGLEVGDLPWFISCIVKETWEEVRQRDWTKNKFDGNAEEAPILGQLRYNANPEHSPYEGVTNPDGTPYNPTKPYFHPTGVVAVSEEHRRKQQAQQQEGINGSRCRCTDTLHSCCSVHPCNCEAINRFNSLMEKPGETQG